MSTIRTFAALGAAILTTFFASQTQGATITLDAIQDTWISPTNTSAFRTTPRNGNLLDIKSGSNSTGASTTSSKRYGVVEFDLSGVPKRSSVRRYRCTCSMAPKALRTPAC